MIAASGHRGSGHIGMGDLFPYGLDAPPVVRNLALAALACWVLFFVNFIPVLPLHVFGLQWPALGLSLGAAGMLWGSRFGKLRRRERLLDRLQWRGDEQVVDIGCGRGLMAVAAARRVPRGSVVGIDIWQAEDLSGNGADAVLANAAREGVAGRVEARTADMRELPFADAAVDVVVSATAIHNVYERAGRDRAIDEIARVLKPGGEVLVDDIRHLGAYAARLRGAGFDVELAHGVRGWCWLVLSFGNLFPGTLLGRKPAAGLRR